MKDQLDAIQKDLQEMKADIKDIKYDVRRLAGLPIEKKISAVFSSIINKAQRPVDQVYIDIDAVETGPNKDFQPSDDNPSFPLVKRLVGLLAGEEEEQEDINQPKSIGTILVGGQSGSGKS